MRSDVVVIASIDAIMQPALQDNQLMSKHRVLSFKPQLRLAWRGQDGQNETEQPDHSARLGDSITSSTRIRGFGLRPMVRRPLASLSKSTPLNTDQSIPSGISIF